MGVSSRIELGAGRGAKGIRGNRLLKLASFLRTVSPKRFNYRIWVGRDWKGGKDLSCGTAACAIGWATVIPAFRRLGLRMRMIGNPNNSGGSPSVVVDGKEVASGGISSAQWLFGIDQNQAIYLFVPRGEREYRMTPKQVARKIERFVQDDGLIPRAYRWGGE